MEPFDYRTASAEAVLAKGRELRGKTLGEIGLRLPHEEARRGKSEVGHIVEAFFGIPRNSRHEADFPGSGIELKVVPLNQLKRAGLRVKERTVLTMIDYDHLVTEAWSNAKVREKLHILFVFFEHLTGEPKTAFPIRAVTLWEADRRLEGFLRADWERVRKKVLQGRAHELSESDGRMMGPSTKGPGGGKVRGQPFGDMPARSRAFALKPSLTLQILRETERALSVQSLGVPEPETFEEALLKRFEPYVGRRVEDVAAELHMPLSDAKNFAASVTRRLFGAKRGSRITEFEEMGLTIRIARVDPDLRPYEAMSFPKFRYLPLLEETWEDSELLSQIEYMLIVPLHGARKNTPQRECTFGTPRFWRPGVETLELIRKEWEIYRIEIERGKADNLTPASETVAIHVRPHGRNKEDTDEAPLVGSVVKKSFWLNIPFVQAILRSER
ncbi:MAG: mismatch repair protein MutH [Actinomycetota bacterium]|nr:mismatch repair protein MutH [Actinomycetota bacterium]